MTDCTFCMELLDVDKSEFRSFFPRNVLKSRIVRSSENFVCLAALGAIRDGYILMLPKKHMNSFAFLDLALAHEAHELKVVLTNEIMNIFSDPIIFEHGVIDADNPSGGCIDHAHLHFFPSEVDLFTKLSSEFAYKPIKHLCELLDFSINRQPYLYYEKNNQGFAFFVDKTIPSQFMRKVIMEQEGKSDEWDWSLFVGKEHVIRTVRLLTDYGR
jgi:diadenosine tetraphosphate (Ap4A) HIT family hydrolase